MPIQSKRELNLKKNEKKKVGPSPWGGRKNGQWDEQRGTRKRKVIKEEGDGKQAKRVKRKAEKIWKGAEILSPSKNFKGGEPVLKKK